MSEHLAQRRPPIMHRQATPPGTSVHASDRTTSTQDCRPVRSQGELATKERPQAVLYPQPQWWQKSGGPLPILAKAEAQAEAIGTHPRHGSNGGKKQWQEAMAGITIKFSCGICIELKLNNWIGAVATLERIRNRSRVTGHRSQITGHRSQVTGHNFYRQHTPIDRSLFCHTHTQTRGGLDVPAHTTLHNPLGSGPHRCGVTTLETGAGSTAEPARARKAREPSEGTKSRASGCARDSLITNGARAPRRTASGVHGLGAKRRQRGHQGDGRSVPK